MPPFATYLRLYGRQVNSPKLITRIQYIHMNPVRAGLVANAEDYLYSSAHNYAGLHPLLQIDEI